MDYASVGITTNYVNTTNAIRMSVYKNSNYYAVVQFINEPAGAHAGRVWAFANLERELHHYQLEELDSGGSVTGVIIPAVDFLPSNQTFQQKDDVLIQAGVSLIPGTNTLWPTTGNTVTIPDWIGWDIKQFVYPGGVGNLKYTKNSPVDMSWNPATGLLTLNGQGVTWQSMESYLIYFKDKIITSSGGVGGSGAIMPIMEIKVDTILTVNDIGKRILITPNATSIKVTLPDYGAVAEGVITSFEMSVASVPKTAMLQTFSGQVINWLEGGLAALYMNRTESFDLYKRAITSTNFEWRITKPDGNYKIVGEKIYDDMIAANVLNKILCDGTLLNKDQYGNLYNRYVLRLPSSQVVAFADWNNNQTMWSYADATTGSFHLPNLTGLFMRSGTLPGTFVADSIGNHNHLVAIVGGGDNEGGLTNGNSIYAAKDNGQNNAYILSGGSAAPSIGLTGNPGIFTVPGGFILFNNPETAPKHCITRIYVRC